MSGPACCPQQMPSGALCRGYAQPAGVGASGMLPKHLHSDLLEDEHSVAMLLQRGGVQGCPMHSVVTLNPNHQTFDPETLNPKA